MLPCFSSNTIYKLKCWQKEWKKETGGALHSGNEVGLANDRGCPGKKRTLEITQLKPNAWGILKLLREQGKVRRKAG